MPAITILHQSSGVQSAPASTTITITLPTYSTGDVLVLMVTRNQTDATAWSGDANASVTQIGVAGTRRTVALQVTPVASATSFVLSANTSAIWQWVCFNVGSPDMTHIATIGSDIGTNTTSAIQIPTVTLGYTATGNELSLVAAATNSTATWTTDGNTVFSGTAQPGLLVSAQRPTLGATTETFSDIDRGLNGTNRYETALVLTLTPPFATTNTSGFFAFFN